MAELRHSSSLGSRASSSSPMKRDDDSSPLVPDSRPFDDDGDGGRHSSSRDRDRPLWSQLHSLWPPHFSDDPRVAPRGSRIAIFLLLVVALVGLISIFSIVRHLVSGFRPLRYVLDRWNF